ncbi:hypothetical protein AURDEDRAFT_128834 [Auricularia subglabra TFB-10046 SS5]|nr:hypothetical protein AURDEDRAFT_128834 [Auricularia subglabra TFB-10046 SS5]
MTSFLLSGYLAVSNGRRLASENPTTKKTTHHMYYDTVIQTMGVDVPAEIRLWVPSSEQPLADGTIVDLLAKVHTPANSKAMLDAIQLNAFPGDPNGDGYEDHIPERPFPTIIVLGHTSGAAETMDDGVSVGYHVSTSEYVRDQSRASRVYCRFDGTKARWKRTPRPSAGSAIFVLGVAHGVHLSGASLIIDVDQLQLNVGSTSASVSAARVESGVTNGTQGNAGPPAKRRRFPTTVAAGPSGSQDSSSPSGVQGGTVLDPNAPVSNSVEETAQSEEPISPGSRVRRVGGRRKLAARADDIEE